jgi:hypothetical protein
MVRSAYLLVHGPDCRTLSNSAAPMSRPVARLTTSGRASLSSSPNPSARRSGLCLRRRSVLIELATIHAVTTQVPPFGSARRHSPNLGGGTKPSRYSTARQSCQRPEQPAHAHQVHVRQSHVTVRLAGSVWIARRNVARSSSLIARPQSAERMLIRTLFSGGWNTPPFAQQSRL